MLNDIRVKRIFIDTWILTFLISIVINFPPSRHRHDITIRILILDNVQVTHSALYAASLIFNLSPIDRRVENVYTRRVVYLG